jgi:glycolate oxidase FAD binding subunit
VRAGAPGDEVDAVRPGQVARVVSADELADALQAVSQARRSTVIRGGGTKLGWGRPPRPIDVLLDTRGLDRILAHRHGDLTLTVEGGARLADVQRALADARQWLPLDSAFEEATIGGLLATNDSGPLRHRHGTPRDLLLGVTLATTDGRLVRAGGQVVKNVAGYDLGKLVCGSFGTLAAVVNATFKLSPVPPPSVTLVAEFAGPAELASAAARISDSQLEPLAFDVYARSGTSPGSRLLVRFASTPRAVAAQRAEAQRLLAPAVASVHEGPAEQEIWRAQTACAWQQQGAVLRVSWQPAALEALVERLDRAASDAGLTIELTGRAAVGAGLVRLDGDPPSQGRIVSMLRTARPAIGAVTVLGGDRALKDLVDVWGAPPNGQPALEAIKRMFDPAGVLNAGRGPL